MLVWPMNNLGKFILDKMFSEYYTERNWRNLNPHMKTIFTMLSIAAAIFLVALLVHYFGKEVLGVLCIVGGLAFVYLIIWISYDNS